MTHNRIIRLNNVNSIETLCVKNNVMICMLYKSEYDEFSLNTSRNNISASVFGSVYNNINKRWVLQPSSSLYINISQISYDLNDYVITVTYYKGNAAIKCDIKLTCIDVSLDVDADRDGIIERDNPKKATWEWGKDGHGAVVLVNCDCEYKNRHSVDCDNKITSQTDLLDMSQMILRIEGPRLPKEYTSLLYVSHTTPIDVVRVHKINYDTKQIQCVLDSKTLKYTEKCSLDNTFFYVEGCQYPSQSFNGLIHINLKIVETKSELPSIIFKDVVCFKIAPWIMVSNISPPVNLHTCVTVDNSKFLYELKQLCEKDSCPLQLCSIADNRGDRWIQDEIEFGYIDSPHKSFPVVLDSPRNRGLANFARKSLLGPDFGYINFSDHLKDHVTNLDSFGNLEVSPPVTVNNKEYPLGRIIIGCNIPIDGSTELCVRTDVKDFLYSQGVQDPIMLYSTWLTVGHIDEFMTFIPFEKSNKKFKLILASPALCLSIFNSLDISIKMYPDQPNEMSIEQMINPKSEFFKHNHSVQHFIDINREILKTELGLAEEDIIDIPALFTISDEDKKANAYFPNMVNMIVLNKHLGIPKPFGPKVNEEYILEKSIKELLKDADHECIFIDDYLPYHIKMGEIHCGTNIQRARPSFRWWNISK
ncbi:hypothetical protein nvc2_047 [Namao virus]|nr:hypothetical protein nvc2_047 [Namao virus]